MSPTFQASIAHHRTRMQRAGGDAQRGHTGRESRDPRDHSRCRLRNRGGISELPILAITPAPNGAISHCGARVIAASRDIYCGCLGSQARDA